MRVSVVIPLYNKETWVRRAIDSVLAQTLPPGEIVIVDDGSTDGSAAAVAEIADDRIRLIRQLNAGVSAARNRGADLSTSPWIAFLDADDWWECDFLQKCAELYERYPEAILFGTNQSFDNGDKTVFPVNGPNPWIINDFAIEAANQLYPPITNASCVVKKERLLAAGGFPVGVALGEDIDTWLRLSLEGPFVLDRRCKIHYSEEDQESAVKRLKLRCTSTMPACVVSYKRLAGKMQPLRRKSYLTYAQFALTQCLIVGMASKDWESSANIFRYHASVAGRKLFATLLGITVATAKNRLRACLAIRTRLNALRAKLNKLH